MTMPHERTRAVIQARAFLRTIHEDLSLPAHVREQAWRLLRHYPSDAEMERAAQRDSEVAGMYQVFGLDRSL